MRDDQIADAALRELRVRAGTLAPRCIGSRDKEPVLDPIEARWAEEGPRPIVDLDTTRRAAGLPLLSEGEA